MRSHHVHNSVWSSDSHLPHSGFHDSCHSFALIYTLVRGNKYLELKNSWGARAPLNLELLASNFPMYVQ